MHDTTAPTISRAHLSHRRFAVATARPTRASKSKRTNTPKGTTFTFTLSEAARTTITIAQPEPGRRAGKRCVAPRKSLKHACTRVVTVMTLHPARTGKGANHVAFSGRAGRVILRPGSYQATLTARDGAGNRSPAVVLRFTVVRPG